MDIQAGDCICMYIQHVHCIYILARTLFNSVSLWCSNSTFPPPSLWSPTSFPFCSSSLTNLSCQTHDANNKAMMSPLSQPPDRGPHFAPSSSCISHCSLSTLLQASEKPIQTILCPVPVEIDYYKFRLHRSHLPFGFL